jgi:phosphoribosylformylglycinamidine synthase
VIGPINNGEVLIKFEGTELFEGDRRLLQRQWAETSYQIQRLRDNADCADQEFDLLLEEDNPGLSVKLGFDVNDDIAAPYIKKACARKWPSCASRASTARSRWPPPSTAPALPRSTCT